MVQKQTYNINELLDKKKFLEAEIYEKQHFDQKEVTYQEEEIVDRLNSKNNRKVVPRAQVTLNEFVQTYNSLVEELAKVKTAIQQFNAKEVSELLQKRDSVRRKIQYLQNIKTKVPRDKTANRQVISQDSNGVPVETILKTVQPMFELSEVEKQLNELAAEERKLNTEIQKLNLNAKISL